MKDNSNTGKQEGTRTTSDRFSTGLGVLMATLGSAVGLGNIWKFPYLTGSNGGAAFLVIYIICTILVGYPIMIAEHSLGRKGRGDAVSTFKKLAPKSVWWIVGAMGILAAFLIMAYYTEVAGWVFAYVFKSFGSGLLSTDPAVTTSVFTSLVTNPVQSLVWQWVVLIVVSAIILMGVTKGIEGTTKKLLPILAILLVIIGIRSITLPNAAQGLSFLFKPDFSKITAATVLTALGLAFFKLSIGMGAMLTYGSYYGDSQNIPANAARVVAADLTVSILAGIAIFPAVFSFGFEPAAGTQLLFITIPSVFASMPFGKFFMILFFLLTSFAAIGAMISLVEVVVAFLVNYAGMDRKKATLLTAAGMAVFGSLAALSNSSLSAVTIFGKTFFDFYDFTTSNIFLPVGGLLLAVFTAWIWGWNKFHATTSNEGTITNVSFTRIIFSILKYVTPILVAIILLAGLNIVHL